MTGLSHLDPAFSNVVAIEAVNEPIMDASQTPGYGDCRFLQYAPSIVILMFNHPFLVLQSRKILSK
jgi:hypothetical protein